MRRLLITGATGFVGRQILNALDRPEIALDLIVRTGKEHQITERGCLGRVKTSPDIFSESEEWWAEQCQGI
ncbi:MAG: NAD(P)-dependent oxidoreductase, partial [Gammaproteobacteria bacterium SHHR-1]